MQCWQQTNNKTKSSASAEVSDWVKLHRKCLFTPRRPIVKRCDSFWGRMAL